MTPDEIHNAGRKALARVKAAARVTGFPIIVQQTCDKWDFRNLSLLYNPTKKLATDYSAEEIEIYNRMYNDIIMYHDSIQVRSK
jgi:hypothetical protein